MIIYVCTSVVCLTTVLTPAGTENTVIQRTVSERTLVHDLLQLPGISWMFFRLFGTAHRIEPWIRRHHTPTRLGVIFEVSEGNERNIHCIYNRYIYIQYVFLKYGYCINI
jgi:hypothetical protein